MIKFILNKVPRGVLQRLAGAVMPLVRLFYAIGRGRKGGGRADKRGGGRGVECPLCGGRYRRFMPYGYVSVRKNALCPKCLALERHRLLWLWLESETNLLSDRAGGGQWRGHISPRGSNKESDQAGWQRPQRTDEAQNSSLSAFRPHREGAENGSEGAEQLKILHVAPEVCLMKRFEEIFPAENYITADLESPLARVKMDVQAIPFPDGEFDVIFCNHVLEHVADDRRAMREMYRVMRTGGWGVMLSPVDAARSATFEDDSIVSAEERTRIFGQYDHRRIYGTDYADRLREAGFSVEERDYFAELPEEEQRKYGLRSEVLYIVRK